jgi:hypothetical protein
VTTRLLARFAGQRIALAAPLPAMRSAAALRERLAAEGYARLLLPDGSVADAAELSARGFARVRAGARLLIDRLAGIIDAVITLGGQKRNRQHFQLDRQT